MPFQTFYSSCFGLTLRGFGPNNAPCVPMAQVARDNGEAMSEIFELRQEGEDLYISGGYPLVI